jgi:N,N'-diacetyllegionaminate synthase
MLKLKKKKTFIIAEVGLAHDGSLGIAKSLIDAAAKCGADAIKFQTHIAEAESTLNEKFRIKFSSTDKTRYEYWKRTSFSKAQWKHLKNYCKKKKIHFLSSVFSLEAVNLLHSIGLKEWKLGSGEVFNIELINKIISLKNFIILSTGLSNWSDIKKIVNYLKKKKIKFGLMQCTSKYPTTNKDVGINIINTMRKNFNCPVGLSDHSGKIYSSLLAIANYADFIEVHVTFDRQMFGPDSSSSLNFDELKFLVTARNEFFEILSNPVNKNKLGKDFLYKKKLFGKSIALKKDQLKGHVINKSDLTFKKPGFGINKNFINKIIGKKLNKNLASNMLLKWEDFS